MTTPRLPDEFNERDADLDAFLEEMEALDDATELRDALYGDLGLPPEDVVTDPDAEGFGYDPDDGMPI